MKKIYGSISDTIGGTPLVALKPVPEQHGNIVAKVEYFNPAGSVKDRIARQIVVAARDSGQLPEGGTLVEATSGNTGIALALVAAAQGYKTVITMPSSMSKERRALMQAYGAELVLTEPSLGMQGAVDAAEQIAQERPGAVLARQFANPANVAAHVYTTAAEVWEDTAGDIDYFVAGIGTGGTITGVGTVLKDLKPQVKVIGVEPADSPLLTKGTAGPHKLQGLGANFVPEILDQSTIDEIVTVGFDEALEAARQVAVSDGLLVGISSGAALAAARKVASDPDTAGKVILVLLPDGGERYLTTDLYSHLMD